MNAEDVYTVEPLSEEPDLPEGFVGGFERVTNMRTGDCETALYVFRLVAGGQKAYVGTFFGSFPPLAWARFHEWYFDWIGASIKP